ncbi:hypothetical protein [Botrimarina sp.]|uniref:hypothetical protein n=1 Tax=Botrimarina sp. TaxID=2795802 RepID=UPI0032EE0181
MNANERVLLLFSLAAVVVFALMIIVPTLKRKHEALSFWNLFLLGSLLFTGLSGVNAATTPDYSPLAKKDYYLFYVGAVVYYTAAAFAYCYLKGPRKLAGKSLRKWPPMTSVPLMLLTALVAALAVFQMTEVSIPFVGEIVRQFALQSPLIALTIAFVAWYQRRGNVLWLVNLLALLVLALLWSLAAGTSRRYLLSMLMVIPIGVYWLTLRYKSISQTVLWVAISMAVVLPVLAGYSLIRHSFYWSGESGLELSMAALEKLPRAIQNADVTSILDGQDSVEVGLTTIHYVNNPDRGVLTGQHFFVPYYVLVNPIPRSVWPEKPESIGAVLPRQLGVWKKTGYINWGVNVVGQCYYDGGLHIHLLYGLITGWVLRLLDEMLIRKPGNPFMLALLSASSSQVLALSRGCIETFIMQIVAASAVVLFIAWLGRVLFGSKIIDPDTSWTTNAYQAEAYTMLARAGRLPAPAPQPRRRAYYDDEPDGVTPSEREESSEVD